MTKAPMTKSLMTKPLQKLLKKTPGARLAAAAAAAKALFRSRPTTDRTVSSPKVERTETARPNAYAPRPMAGPNWLKFVPEEVRGLVESHLPAGLPNTAGGLVGSLSPSPAIKPAVPGGAQFLAGQFTNHAGSRPYKLYIPASYHGEPVPLVVMLHGCTQSPDDFAAGTGMNDLAEAQSFLVVYPGQTVGAHAQKCWKWFSPGDQNRDQGEPSLIAGITRQVVKDYAIDPHRVYVAGLSAGGAAAAIMGETYPDLYAAVGVHSGLACGAAHDLASALAAMKRGSSASQQGRPKVDRRIVPAIVFHGDRDATVSSRNGDDIVARALDGISTKAEATSNQTENGLTYSRTIHADAWGQPVVEQWVIHDAGHTWSGGNTAGSYTEPRGPNASREMMRFFQAHPHPAAQ